MSKACAYAIMISIFLILIQNIGNDITSEALMIELSNCYLFT